MKKEDHLHPIEGLKKKITVGQRKKEKENSFWQV